VTTNPVPGWTDSLPYALYRANQAVHRRLLEAIDGMGVTITQLGLAVHLDELGHLSGSDLARRFKITPQSVSTALNHLERIGWVRRVPHPVHGRVIWYEVTPVGLDGVKEGRRRVASVQAELGELIGAERMSTAIERLHDLTVAVDGPDAPAEPLWPAP